MFLWRSLRSDAVTILLRYLANRGTSPNTPPAADERPGAVEAAAGGREPARR